MAYRALLFCPDEKAARTVTQVLGELDFMVEPCLEPFAAVKRLMGEHFDAVVVDCDNEQNATLLFKSARNSTSNQASLAVAVVEGQAGVAKAFRIGANLVLTKPINIEQSKGTLRVARGLLRKGEPMKAGAPTATTSAPPSSVAKPGAPKPLTPARATGPVAATAATTPHAAAPPVVKPADSPALAATASSAPVVHDKNLVDVAISSTAVPVRPEVDPASPTLHTPRLPVPTGQAPSIELTSGFKSATPGGVFAGGAASAPAPAREHQDAHVADATPASPAKDAAPTAEAVAAESHTSHAAASAFTFGGANVPAESSGGSKKILLGVAAAVIVAAGLYFGWTYFQGRGGQPAPTSSSPAPVEAVPATTKPSSALPKPASTTPASSSPSPGSSLAAQPAPDPATRSTVSDTESAAEDNDRSDAPSSTKSSPTGGKVTSSAKPAGSPLIVKGGAVPATHIKPAAAPDASAPSMIGLATTGSSAPPPDLVSSSASAPRPVLQTLNISQGVSQGLLIKKVQPQYPRNALSMHVEGAVELIATISTSGNISKVKILSGEKLLTGAAADAVKQWKYRPYLLNGEPVEIQTQITVNFKLPH